jgi:predicted amidophosphoribosyltransferase
MSETTCPACKSENAEDALFCDQCGQNLSKQPGTGAPEEAEYGGCPACGGEVEELANGGGRCRSCGLELAAMPDEPEDAITGVLAQSLTEAIIADMRRGRELESAVADACRRILGAGNANPDAPAPSAPLGRACPVCGESCAAGAARCPKCAVWFAAKHAAGPCPSCGTNVSSDKCACGALLTVPAIAKALEPSVRFLCAKCKQPFVSPPERCPDCGGAMISVGRLRAGL